MTPKEIFKKFCNERGMSEEDIKACKWYAAGMIEFAEWLLKESGSEWISVNDQMPPIDENVLLLYSKGSKGKWNGRKGQFVTQGFYKEEVIWDKSIRRMWYDYTERQIQDIDANSKNCVTHWKHLPVLPNS